ncbi:WD repeat and HMG-box DNA-binding protein 1-like [Schistocerca gregaria]|uniref:WD repeat and HMG-box DNA-binding protein 1-like n=1 Tax=Schistocerca gregaria TaxID=7010 RepID=UPI00211ED44F|nr:WD repeat and HMG-box DNA-binding protein 1-like [Schistocerca gregaria]
MVNLADLTQAVEFKVHNGPVKSLAFSPQKSCLVSAGADGFVHVWEFRQSAVKKLASLPVIPFAAPENNRFSRFSWSPDGKQFAVPTLTGLLLVDGDTWQISAKLSALNQESLCLDYSPCGGYICASHVDKSLVIWSAHPPHDVKHRVASDVLVTCVHWSHVDGKIYAASENGHYAIFKYAPSVEKADRTALLPVNELEGEFDLDDREKEDLPAVKRALTDSLPDYSAQGCLSPDSCTAFPPSQNEDVTSPPLAPSGDSFRPLLMNSSPLDHSRRYLCWTEAGSVVCLYDPATRSSLLQIDMLTSDHSATRRSCTRTLSKPLKIICASLCADGVLMAGFPFDDGADLSADARQESKFRRPAVSHESGFSPDSRGTDAAPTVLLYHGFQAHSQNSSNWTFRFPDPETVDCVACSPSFYAASTSLGMLRLFSPGGFQTHVFSLPRRALCLAAHGSFLAAVLPCCLPLWSRAQDAAGDPSLAVWLADMQSRQLLTPPVPLPFTTARSRLQWLGFSSAGQCLVYDAGGYLHALTGPRPVDERRHAARQLATLSWNSFCWCPLWTPILSPDKLDIQKSAVWPISLDQNKLRCLLFERSRQSPRVAPRPIPHTIELCVPLLLAEPTGDGAVGEEVAQLEQSAMLTDEYLSYKKYEAFRGAGPSSDGSSPSLSQPNPDLLRAQASVDQQLLRLFKVSCQEDKTERALAVARRLVLRKSIGLAAQIAQLTRQDALADRVRQELLQEPGDSEASKECENESVRGQLCPAVSKKDAAQDESEQGRQGDQRHAKEGGVEGQTPSPVTGSPVLAGDGATLSASSTASKRKAPDSFFASSPSVDSTCKPENEADAVCDAYTSTKKAPKLQDASSPCRFSRNPLSSEFIHSASPNAAHGDLFGTLRSIRGDKKRRGGAGARPTAGGVAN